MTAPDATDVQDHLAGLKRCDARCTCNPRRRLDGIRPTDITERVFKMRPDGRNEEVEPRTRTNVEIAREAEQRACERRARREVAARERARRSRAAYSARLAESRARMTAQRPTAVRSVEATRESRGTSHSSTRPASRSTGGGRSTDGSGSTDGGDPPSSTRVARTSPRTYSVGDARNCLDPGGDA